MADEGSTAILGPTMMSTTVAEVGAEAAKRAADEGKTADEIERERIRAQQKLNAAVATAERRSNERPGVMKRARWGATHRIHEHFVDGFPELEERFVREREAAERRFEYNLGSRNFASKREGEEGIDTLKVLFRKLDRAIGLRDANMVQSIREDFLAELRHWNWRKGARVEFKRRKMVQNKVPHPCESSSRSEDGDEVSATKENTAPAPKDHDDLTPPNSQGLTPPPSLAAAASSSSSNAGGAAAAILVDGLPPKGTAEDDSSVDDLDADDVNAIDDRVRRLSPAASPALKVAATAAASSSSHGTTTSHPEKLQVAEARRHLLAESVAIALVTLKWRAMRPHDLEAMRKEADKRAKQLEMLEAS